MDTFIEYLTTYQPLFLTFHILAMAIGLGGATVSDILFFTFLKDYRVSKKETEVLHILKHMILTAMLFIAITGIALYIPKMDQMNASPMFQVKALVTSIVILNGFALHVFIAPYLVHLNLRSPGSIGRNWHRLAFALGGVSVCSWYSAFLIAMLKSVMPFTFAQLLGLYLALLGTAVIGSQILEIILTKKAHTTRVS